MLQRVIEVPVSNDSLPFLFTGLGEELNLTNLQKVLMNDITQLQKLAVHRVSSDLMRRNEIYFFKFKVFRNISLIFVNLR